MGTVAIYKFSPVGKWHRNAFCTGMKIINSKVISVRALVVMDTNGRICRKCKGPARASE